MAVRYELIDTTALITLDRPQALNAINVTLARELTEAWGRFTADEAATVAVLTGAGRAFCSGLDMRETAEAVRSGRKREPMAVPNPIDLPKPTIAAVNGPAAGGGVLLAVQCDLAICSTNAVFTLPFAAVGVGPTKMILELARRTSFSTAMYLALASPRVDAEAALRLGLVQEILPPEELLPRALDLAEKIAGQSAAALRAMKAGLRRALEIGYAEAIREVERGGPVAFTEDAAEGALAFDEKRRPRFGSGTDEGQP